ncbi:glycosyltransferase family 4 protein [Halobellus marinus]|uniref:glycosyltransferase family 4 protein n=1 Tax=Halobellus TaxID=1073986 RepID=UPI0028AF1B2E|nr:glycosyltransferase family 4 protein [Halobellus sp. DFY28]
MRVAIIVRAFPPDVIGGMQTQTKQMGTELHRAGHNVTVFTRQFGEHDDSDVPYEVVRIRNWKINSFISHLTFLLFALFAVVRRSDEFDCVQCMMLYPVGFLGYVINKLTGLPYFAWIRGGDYYLMNDVHWKRWTMRKVLADTLVLAQSKEIRSDVLSDFNDIDCNIQVLGNAVSVPDETATGDGALYVGRLAPKKGIEYLIEAISEIECHLTIVGDGSERERLEKLVEQTGANVTFEGKIPPGDVSDYYRSAGFLVLPSTEGEGMPNVVLEAMAWGLPVIATDSGGLPTVIDDGTNGYLVPMRDPDALQDAIETLLEDPETSRKMGKNAKQYVRENHSWNELVDSLEDVYKEVIYAD